MNIHDRQAETNAIYQAIAQMESSEAQDIVKKIFNLIERLASDKLSLETELQQLRDEVNRLKGEQGKPDIKPNKNNKGDDISSEDERKKAQVDAQKETNNDTENTDSDKKKRRRKPKIPRVKIDQTLKCLLDKTGLPSDLSYSQAPAWEREILEKERTTAFPFMFNSRNKIAYIIIFDASLLQYHE
ncbi:MAG: hypothetical protein Q9M50_14955 [Methylococcales bacterium]|nr:hypothetical protein [Methylococcales bacterium]